MIFENHKILNRKDIENFFNSIGQKFCIHIPSFDFFSFAKFRCLPTLHILKNGALCVILYTKPDKYAVVPNRKTIFIPISCGGTSSFQVRSFNRRVNLLSSSHKIEQLHFCIKFLLICDH